MRIGLGRLCWLVALGQDPAEIEPLAAGLPGRELDRLAVEPFRFVERAAFPQKPRQQHHERTEGRAGLTRQRCPQGARGTLALPADALPPPRLPPAAR